MVSHRLEEYDVKISGDHDFRVEEDETLSIYTGRILPGNTEAVLDESVPDSWEFEYDGEQAEIYSGEPPFLVPGTEKYGGLVQEAETYRMTVESSRRFSGETEVRIQDPELLASDEVFSVTSKVLDGLLDLQIERASR